MLITRQVNRVLRHEYFSQLILRRNYSDKLHPVKLSYSSYEKLCKNHSGVENNPLIIMHGLFGSKGNWNSLCKAIHSKTVPSKKIISVDARNHGDSAHNPIHTYESMAEDVVELLKVLEIKKCILMGHSMGGRTMAYVALKYPELVEKLIVVDISPVSKIGMTQTDIPLFLKAMQSIRIPAEQTIHQARKHADMELSRIVSNQAIRDFLITNLVKDDLENNFRWRVNLDAIEQNFESNIMNFPSVDGLQYKGPTLFIGGGNSDYINKDDFPLIQKLFPNAELKYIEGAGHWVHSERPTEFLSLVLEFLNADNSK